MVRASIIDRAFRGDTFRDLHIIDMHCHLGPTSNYYNPAAEIEQMIEDADRVGVEKLCIAPHVALFADHRLGNLQTCDAIQKFPDRVLGYLCLNPNKPNEIDSEFDAYYSIPQFIGVKIHPSSHQYPINGPRYEPIFEKVERLGGILLTHTWESGGTCSAAPCEDVIRRYPNINFILAHSLGLREGVFKAIDFTNKYENAYMDSSGFEYSDITIETIMKLVDNDKVFYGSDMPYHDMRGGVSRILFADLSDETKEKLLGKNYKQLMERSPKRV
jgi:predicted TIM-barrel fold metal-dependent hydrolase